MSFLSVIIPVRNEAAHIADVLDRLLEQKYENFEILVVDGLSSDGTQEIVKKYVERHTNVHLFDNPKRLASAARNVGVRNARGDAVLIIDGHCLIMNRDMLGNVNRAFVETGADCLGRPQPLEMAGATWFQWAVAVARRSPLGHHPDSFIYSNQAQFSPAGSVAVAYRKEVFDRIGLFNEDFDACEDVELNHRVDLQELRCYFEPAIAVHYVPRKTLTGLLYQMVRYGRGRMRLYRKNKGVGFVSFVKSFAPALFLFWLIVTFPAMFFDPSLCKIYFGILALYGIIVLGESFRLAVLGRRLSLLPLLPIVFVALHFGFGYGILRELCRRKRENAD